MRPAFARWGWLVVCAGVALLVSMLALTPPAFTHAQSTTWTYKGDDDVEAAKELTEFMKANGMEATFLKEGAVRTKAGPITLLLDPRPTEEEEVDRIVIIAMFGVKDSAKRDSGKLLQKVNELNRKYNTGGYYLDRDNDLAFQTQITYVDTLDIQELKLTMKWLEKALILGLMGMADDLR